MSVHEESVSGEGVSGEGVSAWMSWESGVDLVATTAPDLASANVIVHVARMVHTPVGSAPSGMILWQPDSSAVPQIMGFVSTDAAVGAYFGPHVFAGTPFENAPFLQAEMSFEIEKNFVASRVAVAGFVFESRLENLAEQKLISREPGALPFTQSGLEAISSRASLRVNGEEVEIFVPPIGISGGPGAVYAPTGFYAR